MYDVNIVLFGLNCTRVRVTFENVVNRVSPFTYRTHTGMLVSNCITLTDVLCVLDGK